MIAVLAAVLAAVTVLLWARPRSRLARGEASVPSTPRGDAPAVLVRLRLPLAGLGFLAGWTLVGGPFGLVAGALTAGVSWRVLGKAESPMARRRRERMAEDLPVGVALLGSCLSAGGAVGPALRTVADALPGPLADEFSRLHHRLALGVDPGLVWRDLSAHPQLGTLGRALGRAHASGASTEAAIEALADDLAARNRAEVEERAKSVDVKAAAPLGACFLPAFLLLGVVPLVAGIFSSMNLFG